MMMMMMAQPHAAPQPQPQYHPWTEMRVKAAGFTMQDLEARIRKGDVEREVYIKQCKRNHTFRQKVNNLSLPHDRALLLLNASIAIAEFLEPDDWHNSLPAVFHIEKLHEVYCQRQQRHRLLQHISELSLIHI